MSEQYYFVIHLKPDYPPHIIEREEYYGCYDTEQQAEGALNMSRYALDDWKKYPNEFSIERVQLSPFPAKYNIALKYFDGPHLADVTYAFTYDDMLYGPFKEQWSLMEAVIHNKDKDMGNKLTIVEIHRPSFLPHKVLPLVGSFNVHNKPPSAPKGTIWVPPIIQDHKRKVQH